MQSRAEVIKKAYERHVAAAGQAGVERALGLMRAEIERG
jgi:hypothetical protein